MKKYDFYYCKLKDNVNLDILLNYGFNFSYYSNIYYLYYRSNEITVDINTRIFNFNFNSVYICSLEPFFDIFNDGYVDIIKGEF